MMFEKNKVCRAKRAKEVLMARMWYKITDGSVDRQAEFPLVQIPWLNQALTSVAFFYGIDDFESAYMGTLGTWLKVADTIEEKLVSIFGKLPFESDREFIGLYGALNKGVSDIKVCVFIIFDNFV